MKVEVCYALEDEQRLIQIEMPVGSVVLEAIAASGLLERYPSLRLDGHVGIFSKQVPLSAVLQNGDRVEIYRPLVCTPNQQRLLRARSKSLRSCRS